jgi:hypothetical protein
MLLKHKNQHGEKWRRGSPGHELQALRSGRLRSSGRCRDDGVAGRGRLEWLEPREPATALPGFDGGEERGGDGEEAARRGGPRGDDRAGGEEERERGRHRHGSG